MTDKLSERKKKLDEKIEKIELQKKLLEAKEKKKKLSEIIKLAQLANIDDLDNQVLLGAFLEIANDLHPDKLNKWKEIANEFKNSQSKRSNPIFSISFEEDPSKEIKRKFKEMKFIWNRFKREYCGQGSREELENLLKSCRVKIEEILN